MKKLITIALIIAAIGLVAFTLSNNKEEMAEKAKLAEMVSDKIPVETGKVYRKKMDTRVTAIGTFEAITDLTMLSQTEGLVIKQYHEKGDFVKKGTLLAQVENGQLQAQTDAAKANLDKAVLDLERFTKLEAKDAVTKRQLEDARINEANARAQYKNTKKMLDETYINATATGTINDDYIQEGSNISRNAKLFDIVDVSKLKLNVKLTGNNVVQIKEGDEISITSDMYPDEKYTGKVTAIAAKADNSLKYGVELLITNNQEKPLKAGMFGTATFNFENPNEALFMDRNALAGSIKQPTVFMVNDSLAIMKRIKIGDVYNDEVQILSGLEEGDKVVVNGQINLKDSTKIKEINTKSISSETAQK